MLRLIRINQKKLRRLRRFVEVYLKSRKPYLDERRQEETDDRDMRRMGGLITLSVEENLLSLEMTNGEVKMAFFKDGLIGLVLKGADEEAPPTGGLAQALEPARIEVSKNHTGYLVEYDKYRAVIGAEPFTVRVYDNAMRQVSSFTQVQYSGKKMRVIGELREEAFFGAGGETGSLDKRGRFLEFYNPAVFGGQSNVTASIPFIIGVLPEVCYGIFIDEAGRSFFDLRDKESERFCFGADRSSLRYYLIPGHCLKEVTIRFTELTGRMLLPPLWALGFQVSQWNTLSAEDLYREAQIYRKKKIPADALYLSLDSMDDYRVFSFDRDFIPHPRKTSDKLESMGFKTVVSINPGIKRDPTYPVYMEGIDQGYFLKGQKEEVFIEEGWPGETVFPDLLKEEARSWWTGLVKNFLVSCGINGVWTDRTERVALNDARLVYPANLYSQSDREIKTLRGSAYNTYSRLATVATYNGLKEANPDSRPFLLTRAGFAGVQRFAALWTGSGRSRFEEMASTITSSCSLGLSGVAFVGSDIGGFSENCSPELFARWIAMGVLTPFCRIHRIGLAKSQAPWSFGPEIEKICQEFLTLRYRLLPYIYNQFYQANRYGLPLMRPLILERPDDPEAARRNDEYFFGGDFLVAPVLENGLREREVYLPKGEWFDFWSDRRISGGKTIKVDAPLNRIPLFIRGEAVVPSWRPVQSTSTLPPQELFLDLYPVSKGEYLYYEDDGATTEYQNSVYNEIRLEHRMDDEELTVFLSYSCQRYEQRRQRIILRAHGLKEVFGVEFTPESCKSGEESCAFHAEKRLLEIVIPENRLREEMVEIRVSLAAKSESEEITAPS